MTLTLPVRQVAAREAAQAAKQALDLWMLSRPPGRAAVVFGAFAVTLGLLALGARFALRSEEGDEILSRDG